MTKKRRTLRVAIRLSVIIDLDALDAQYGQHHSADDVREMFRVGALSAVTQDGIIVPADIILSGNVS